MLSFICTIAQQFPTADSSSNKATKGVETESLPQFHPPIHTTFHLPIHYIDPSSQYVLSDVVSNDLELSTTTSPNSMYRHLFLPKHEFAEAVMPEWNKIYTTDTLFLSDSQTILQKMGKYSELMENNTMNPDDCATFMKLWKDIKENDDFLDKYNYLDWEMLKHLNESSSFLQCLSMINICSPVISLVIPFFFLLFPFLLLKAQGVRITLSTYVDVLKDVARNHFIGKTLLNMETVSWDKVVYMGVTFGLYLLQIYQNANLCRRFYVNCKKVNKSLCKLQEFVRYSSRSMESYLILAEGCSTHVPFCEETNTHLETLHQIEELIAPITPFQPTIGKLGEIGNMLQCYYLLHSTPEYESCLRYIVGFEGYINNLQGVYENLVSGVVSYAKYSEPGDISGCTFTQQYYPALVGENPVKNTCIFDKNMILSAPNKAGKTTILKTTTLNIIFSQQVGCGFYDSATIVPYTHIHSYLNIPDTSGRDSLFQAESRRCKEILDVIHENPADKGNRHFCIFDELYSGTNPDEASKAGYAFLCYMNKFSHVDFILTTHYVSICKKFKSSERVRNYKMEVRVVENGDFDYTYKIKPGISIIKGALRVLKDMEYPSEIIESMESESEASK